MRIVFLGNFSVSYSSETHHVASLEALGHTVTKLQESQTPGDRLLTLGRTADMVVVVHTHGFKTPGMPLHTALEQLNRAGVPTVTYHLDLWVGLARERDLGGDPFYRTIGHFFTADKQMAEWLNKNTNVAGHYLPPGVYHDECYLAQPRARFDVAFVGSRGYHPEWPYRTQLLDWLRKTYGHGFRHYGGDGMGIVRGPQLNQVYADARVVVGDSLCLGFKYPYYWSDRLPETLGRGGFLVMPFVTGMDNYFKDGRDLVYYTYGDFKALKKTIDYYINHHTERDMIRLAGHGLVKHEHTYMQRWQEIIDTVFGEPQ